MFYAIFYTDSGVIQYLRGVVESVIGQTDINEIKQKIDELLDQSIVTSDDVFLLSDFKSEYKSINEGKLFDLSKIDFDLLKDQFKNKEFKNIEIANLRDFIEQKLEQMLKENSTRTDFAEKLQQIIDKYNSGEMTTENYFDDLVRYAEQMKSEDERYIREGLSKDELELFDVLKKEKLTKPEEIKVKNAEKHLLKRLVEEQPKVLIQDWFKDSQS